MKKIQFGKNKNTLLLGSFVLAILSLVLLVTVLGWFQMSPKSNRTSVSFIYLGNLDEKQYPQHLLSAINEWKTHTQYRIIYQNEGYIIDLSFFEFDLDETLRNIQKNANNTAYFKSSPTASERFSHELISAFGFEVLTFLETERLVNDILLDMQNLDVHRTFHLQDYLTYEQAKDVLASTTLHLVPESIRHQIIQTASSILVLPNTRFSLLTQLDHLQLSNEALSVIASGILGLLPNTHVTGLNFQSNPVLVPWAKLGHNVRILQVNRFDLMFFNDFNLPYEIRISENEGVLTFEWVGLPYLHRYEGVIEWIGDIPFDTLYEEDDSLNPDDPLLVKIDDDETGIRMGLLVVSGKNGMLVNVYRKVTTSKGIYQDWLFVEILEPVSERFRTIILPKENT